MLLSRDMIRKKGYSRRYLEKKLLVSTTVQFLITILFTEHANRSVSLTQLLSISVYIWSWRIWASYTFSGLIHLSGYKSPDLHYKITKSGLQYTVNACQKALGWFSNRVANLEISLVRNFIGSSLIWNTIEVNGDQKLLSQMFCDDKESQANAKRIKNQWDELSSTDKVNEYLFEASGVPRRTLVSTGLLSISPSLECIQLTDFF